jgi:putative addiction module component (TIGR02574 family)
MATVYEPAGQPWSRVESVWRSTSHPLDAVREQPYTLLPLETRIRGHGYGKRFTARPGLDRLSIEERLQVADAIWDSVVHEVETSPLPEWQRAELRRDYDTLGACRMLASDAVAR